MFDKLTEGALSVTISKKQLEDYFHEELHKEDFDVVFNPPYTILKFKDGSETKVKCSGDNFDEYNGVMIALAKKYAPQSHTYIIGQVSKAIRPKPKEFKVGDKVRPLTYLSSTSKPYMHLTGTIVYIHRASSHRRYRVQFEDGQHWYYQGEHLERAGL